MNQLSNIPIQLVPEVEDILDFQVTNQLVLIKPSVPVGIKTASGIILDGVDSDVIRNGLLKTGVVTSIGSKIDGIAVGLTVYYYESGSQGMIRQGDDLYLIFQEYNIIAFIKQ